MTWCSWLFFAVFDCIFQNPLCCWWGRTQGRTEKTTVCIWQLFQTKWQISWRWANFATQAEERKSNNVFFFQVEHLRVWFFIQTKLLLSNFECVQKARTIPGKKNRTAPRLSPITSLPFFFHFFGCSFTVLRPLSLRKPRGWLVSPWKSLYSPCPLNYEAFESCTSFVGVIVDR